MCSPSPPRFAGDDPAAITDILQRTGLAARLHERVASRSGTDWLQFLDAMGGGGGSRDGPGAVLASARNRAAAPPASALCDVATRWVRNHRVDASA